MEQATFEFLQNRLGRKRAVDELVRQRDAIKKKIAEVELGLKDAFLQALKDGIIQVGTAYEIPTGTGRTVVAAVYTTNERPKISFFDKG